MAGIHVAAGDSLVIPRRSKVARPVTKDLVFTFPEGIPAFEDAHQYLLTPDEDIHPFVYLESVDSAPLHFVCLDPFMVSPDYCVRLTGQDASRIRLTDPGHALVLCFVTIGEDPRDTTANLMAPVVINIVECLGRQVIQEDYELHFNLWNATGGD